MRPSRSSLLLLAACGGSAPAPRAPSTVRCGADVVVTEQRDVDALATCESVASLTIRTGARLSTSKLKLREIRGDLAIGPTVAVTDLAFPALREVGGEVRAASNTALHGLFFPALERARAIAIAGNVSLSNLSMPRLHHTEGDLAVTDCSELEVLDLSRLAQVGGALTISGNPLLTVVEADGPLAEKLRAAAVPAP